MHLLALELCGGLANPGLAQTRVTPRRRMLVVHMASQSAELASEPEVMIRRRPPEGKARQPCAPNGPFELNIAAEG